ncbi:MAG: SRPBCC family protein [Gemmataceae bacterium]|nr:SRPBCC family protein [Gemmataceae bacterium]MDW8264364.1 SRPBCC family protein [Gemmataceae bacterium]
MRLRTLEREIWLPRPIDEVFAFFSDAFNLNRLTPPWLRFEVLTPPPIVMRPGTRIDYRLRLHGLPIRWQTLITRWEPPSLFVDEQVRGPYRRWVHHHRFTPCDGGTVARDHVEYAVPGGPFEPLIHRFLVFPDLEAIFAYRHHQLLALFTSSAK